jgi:sulfur-oxidizing protein SoxZ
MKVKAKIKNNITHVRLLAQHPMETGHRVNTQTGEKVPAKYIQELRCEHENKVVFLAQFGTFVSQNPFLSFSFEGAKKGDSLTFRWNDNTGDFEKTEAIIK